MTVVQGSVKRTSVLTAVSAVAVSLAAFSLRADLSAKSYVRDGLLVQWDGIENAGLGAAHAGEATVWTDLSGNGLQMTLPEGASFGETGLNVTSAHGSDKVNGKITGDDGAILRAFQAASYTTEVSYNMTADPGTAKTALMLLLGNTSHIFGAYYSIYENRIGFSPNGEGNGAAPTAYVNVSAEDRTGLHTFACRQDGTNCLVRLDAGKYSKKKTVGSYDPNISVAWKFKFNRGYTEGCGIDGTYHSVRVYGRPLTDDELAVNEAVDRVRYCGANPASTALPAGWRFNTASGVKLEKACAISVKGGVGGTITVNGGATTVEESLWIEHNESETVEVTATATEGYVFQGWSGDIVSGDRYAAATALVISGDVAAVFRKTDGSDPRTYSFVGGADAAWDDPSSWRDENGLVGVPSANDSVTVPEGANLVVGSSTVALNAVVVSGTLTLTNWNASLSAVSVSVLGGGLITSGPAATNAAALSRVWIKCGTLQVAEGGRIDVSKKGYLNFLPVSGYVRGWGPGSAGNLYNLAPSHGGHGARKWGGAEKTTYADLCKSLQTYDDPAAPSLPGSSGPGCNWGKGGNGGGVIRIEATGAVVVNGEVLADGENGSSYGSSSVSGHGCAGSGGSVWIDCASLSGGGRISAGGGGGDRPGAVGEPATNYTYPGMAAGGGMIAVHYDPVAQAAASVEGLVISAQAGLYKRGTYQTSNVYEDDYNQHWYADIGTLHFTDATLVRQLIGKGLTGQVRGVSSYVHDGDLDFSDGRVRFAEDGVNVAVSGNLTLSGTDSRLEIGGDVATNRFGYSDLYSASPCRLTVGGDLTLEGVSRLDIRAGATNGVDQAWGAEVEVAGTMTVGAGCYVYAVSEPMLMSAPKFTVGNLTVCEGGLFSADSRGGSSGVEQCSIGYGGTKHSHGYGPGSSSEDIGAGYGGFGGNARTTYPNGGGWPYGEACYPHWPGSGGSALAEYTQPTTAGGLVFVSARNGTIRVDGRISADAGFVPYGVCGSNGLCSGGSGGGIYLEAKIFTGAASGALSAVGGTVDHVSNTTASSSAGSGGRIAVWSGDAWGTGKRHFKASETVPAEDRARAYCDYLGTFTAAGGKYLGVNNGQDGGDGTVRFCSYLMSGALLLVR